MDWRFPNRFAFSKFVSSELCLVSVIAMNGFNGFSINRGDTYRMYRTTTTKKTNFLKILSFLTWHFHASPTDWSKIKIAKLPIQIISFANVPGSSIKKLILEPIKVHCPLRIQIKWINWKQRREKKKHYFFLSFSIFIRSQINFTQFDGKIVRWQKIRCLNCKNCVFMCVLDI